MAEQRDEDLVLQPADAGAAFRAEMAVSNFLLGYWRHLVGLLVVGLVAVLLYGQYSSMVQRGQREGAARIAEVERELQVPLALLAYQKSQGALELTDAQLEAAGDELEVIAAETSRAASTEAHLKAAELYRIAGSPKRRAALEAAAASGQGVLGYAAIASLAALELEEGKGDEAVARLKAWTTNPDAFLAQQASLELGLALEHLGRADEAAAVYTDFLARWPDAARAGDVRERQGKVGANG